MSTAARQFDLFSSAPADTVAPVSLPVTVTVTVTVPLPMNLSHRAGLPPVLQTLHAWADKGWLRRLDSALAQHMAALDPASPPALWVAVTCLSHLEGRGHTCLPLALLCAPTAQGLSLPAEAQPDVAALWAELPADTVAWQRALCRSALVAPAGQARATSALVLWIGEQPSQALLYLRRYWQDEGDVVHHVRQRVGAARPVDERAAAHWLGRLFARDAGVAPTQVPDWQQWACALALRAGLTVITGGPGTGKTYTAARLLALLFALSPQPQQLRVALAAPTGKAAARLRQSLAQSLAVLAPGLAGTLDLAALIQRIGPARTLHALLGARPDSRRLAHNAHHPLDVDVLVVDEASMINLEMMAALMRAMPVHAQLVLLGDKDQLSSVEAGAVLGDLCRHAHQGHYGAETARYLWATVGEHMPPACALASGVAESALAQQTVMLRRSHRFAGSIGQLALAVNAGNADEAAALLAQAHAGGDLVCLTGTRTSGDDAELLSRLMAVAVAGYGDCLRTMAQGPGSADLQVNGATATDPDQEAVRHGRWVRDVLTAFEGFRLLCAVHDGPLGTQGLNQRVQAALTRAELLNPRAEWFAGRPVMVKRNDPGLGVSNGDVGVVLPGTAGPDGKAGLKACFLEGDTLRMVPVGRLAHVETAFAMTVHKSQGSEFNHVVLVLPGHSTGMLTRELVYTGITRAKKRLTVVEGVQGTLQAALLRPSQRHSGLSIRLGTDGLSDGMDS